MVTKTGPKPKGPMVAGPFGRPEGAPGGARGPVPLRFGPLRFRRPCQAIRQFLEFFLGSPLGPPEAQTHIFPTFFNYFSVDRGPKRSPLGPPVAFCAPPPGPPETPKVAVFFPRGLPRGPRAAPREPKRADSEDTGRQFRSAISKLCFAIRPLRKDIIFAQCCCSPCGKQTF